MKQIKYTSGVNAFLALPKTVNCTFLYSRL